jgi:uncharacterized protein YydD (DUF2326 family)
LFTIGSSWHAFLIDDDIPRDDQDKKMEFDTTEIVRELHDQGDDGRLFRMPRF